MANSIGVWNVRWPPHIVADPVEELDAGRHRDANDVRLKNGRSTAPVVNMWWAHTAMDRLAIAMVARTNAA